MNKPYWSDPYPGCLFQLRLRWAGSLCTTLWGVSWYLQEHGASVSCHSASCCSQLVQKADVRCNAAPPDSSGFWRDYSTGLFRRGKTQSIYYYIERMMPVHGYPVYSLFCILTFKSYWCVWLYSLLPCFSSHVRLLYVLSNKHFERPCCWKVLYK